MANKKRVVLRPRQRWVEGHAKWHDHQIEKDGWRYFPDTEQGMGGRVYPAALWLRYSPAENNGITEIAEIKFIVVQLEDLGFFVSPRITPDVDPGVGDYGPYHTLAEAKAVCDFANKLGR